VFEEAVLKRHETGSLGEVEESMLGGGADDYK
jgi:hypothetical protein